ncbi:MAG: AhpC/TSA family protein [Tannerella sp.]|jgi:thiol-disulfide isomerase/thioredoxin|nr:AhpC/TSA family protein [Tannerella sp.]
MKNAFWIILLIVLAASCSPDKKTYVINGVIPDDAYYNHWVYLFDYNQNEPLDSALVTEGKFSFTGLPDTTKVVRLDLDRKLFANVVREAGTIEVDLSNYVNIGGTPLNEALKMYLTGLNDIYASASEAYEKISEEYKNDEATLFERLKEYQNVALLNYNTLNTEHFDAHKKNAIGSYIFNSWTHTLSPEKVDSLYADLGDPQKNDLSVRRIMETNEKKKRTMIGKPFTDFTIESGNIDGTMASFSDYIGKGKYVLVDFWASWCGPCLAENPVIADVYGKHKGDKFEVLGVAVWDERNATLEAIQTHGIVWPQIIDAQSIPTEIYGISGIPHIMLFGPDGTILARDLRGDALKAKVAEVLK